MNWSVYFKVVLIFQEVLAIDLKHFKEMKQLVNWPKLEGDFGLISYKVQAVGVKLQISEMDLNGGRRPNVFISNPKNPTMSDFTKCLNSCVNYWYDKWNALYMDPSGGVSSSNSKAFRPNLKGYNTFPYLLLFRVLVRLCGRQFSPRRGWSQPRSSGQSICFCWNQPGS